MSDMAHPSLSTRRGERPRTTPRNPHTQLDQQPFDVALVEELARRLFALPGVVERPSGISVPGARALTLAPGARILCTIPRLPLLPGVYTYTVSCRVGGTLEDHVEEAGKLSVVAGDSFGTGKLPPNQGGDFLVAHQWSVR